ncbi:ABC transporter substrate-binding protein [Desulfococcaceae bacterium HSG9]|nr:ABC transporter substrate-binding protein [Desulfococcaceae bacterium HSG9]
MRAIICLKVSFIAFCILSFICFSANSAVVGEWDIGKVQKIPGSITFKGEIKIGIFGYLSGEFAHSGPAEIRGFLARFAQQNEKGGLLGYKIIPVIKDTETNVLQSRQIMKEFVAEEMICVMGGIHSGTVGAASKIAQKHGVIFLNSNSSSPQQIRKDAHRTKFVFDGNGNNFANGVLKATLKAYPEGPIMMIAKPDDWGRNSVKGIAELVRRFNRMLPEENQYFMVDGEDMDFSGAFEKIKQIKPVIITTAISGPPSIKLKRLIERAEPNGPIAKAAWVAGQFDWPEARHGAVNVGGSTWLPNFETPGTREFVEEYQRRYPGAELPGNVYHAAYFAADAFFTAVEELKTFENVALVKYLENLKVPAEKRMQHHDAYMNPQTHHLEQTIYAVEPDPKAKKNSKDVLKAISFVSPEEAEDKVKPGECRLEPYESLKPWPRKSAFKLYK